MNKIVLIGCGNVGMSYAYSLINSQYTIDELVLIDINKEKLLGKILDLEHSLANCNNNMKIKIGEYKDCIDADIVCITAGPSNSNIKNSRLDDLNETNNLFKDIIYNIKISGFSGIYLVASNPLDIMTYITWKYSGAEYNKIIGSGTLLDTARLKSLLSNKYNKNINDINGYVLGEHGDTQFITWSNLNVDIKDAEKNEISETVRNFGYKVAELQGFTCYGIGTALSRITKAILSDENVILPVSTYIENLDVFISTPSLIGKNGVIDNMKMSLSEEENSLFYNSVNMLKSIITKLN